MATAKEVKVRANCKKDICLVAGLAADNGAPASATAGVALYETDEMGSASSVWENGANFPHHPASRHRLFVKGSSTPSATAVLWLYHASSDAWYRYALTLTTNLFATDTTYTQMLEGISFADRVYLQVDWTAGSVDAWITAVEESF
jgi:hypothetical protein